MILLDSSALIEYYRSTGRPAVRDAVESAIRSDLAAVNGVVRTEIVSFAPNDSSYRKLCEDFLSFHWIELDRSSFDLAAEIGFQARRNGLAIPSSDLIIAASTIASGGLLYHLDRHFDQLTEVVPLSARNLDSMQGS